MMVSLKFLVMRAGASRRILSSRHSTRRGIRSNGDVKGVAAAATPIQAIGIAPDPRIDIACRAGAGKPVKVR
jgi:hypothetical protein